MWTGLPGALAECSPLERGEGGKRRQAAEGPSSLGGPGLRGLPREQGPLGGCGRRWKERGRRTRVTFKGKGVVWGLSRTAGVGPQGRQDPSHQTSRTAGHVDHGRRGLGLALEPAELRHYGSRKDRVLLGPTTPPGWSEQRRWPKSLDAGPGRGPGRGAPTCRAQRFPSPSPGAVLRQEPGRVQSNLAAPSLILTDADRLMNSSPQQQSNLPPPARPQGRARDPAVQQSNLSARGAGLAGGRRCSPRPPPELQESVGPRGAAQGSPRPPGSLACPSSTLRSPRLLATDTPCPDVPPAAGSAPFNGCAQPDSGPWGGLRSGPSRLVGEPLTLEDLTVPVHGRAQAPSHTAVHQLLASVRHLERAVARLGCRPSQEAPGPAQRAPWSSSGQALAAPPQPGRPGLAPWGGRKEHPGRLGGSADCPETRGSQAGPAGSQASRRPASSLEATLGTLAGDCLAPKDGVPPATPQRQEESSPGPPRGSWQRGDPQLPPGAGSREARRCSWALSSAARGVPPGRGGGEVAPQEQSSREEERTASGPQTQPQQGAAYRKKPETSRAWSPRQPAGRGCPHVSEPGGAGCRGGGQRLPWWPGAGGSCCTEACGRFGGPCGSGKPSWRRRGGDTLGPCWPRASESGETGLCSRSRGSPPSGLGQDPHALGQEEAKTPQEGGPRWTPPGAAGSQREEAAAWPGPDGGDGGAQMLQALGHLAVFLLWCHQKKWDRQDRGAQRENPRVPPRTQGMGRPPEAWRSHAVDAPRTASPDTQPRRAWLGRCFGAWHRFTQRGAGFRERLAHRRAHTLRLCLQQWLRMRRLRASDGAKVTQLSLCRQKAGSATLCGAAPGVAPARGLGVVARVQAPAQEQGQGSLQEACRRLALQRALLLWRMRLSQRRRPETQLGLPCDLNDVLGSHVFRCLPFGELTSRRPVSPSLHPSRGRAPTWLPPESGVLGPGAQLHLPSGAWLRSASISDRALRQLQHILSGGHLTAWGLSASAPELLGSLPGGEPWLGSRPLRSSPQQAFRAPAPLETLGLSFRWASGQRRKGRCLRLWQVRARQSRGAARWCLRALQRRVLLGWSRWASAQGAQRELAVGWARGRCGRAALRWWRRRLAQRLEVEQRVRARGRALARGALQRWRTCWQRQQFLHGKYQRWVQVHCQGLRRSMFQRWRRAAARRRRPGAPPEQLLLHSHSLAWCAVVRDTGALPTTGAFRGGPGEARGAAWAVWQGARAAEAWARERRVARASVGRWRKRMQERWADRQLWRAQAQQAFAAWRTALGQRCRVRQLAEERATLCQAPHARESRLHRGSRARAARKLSARGLGAWAQAAVKGRIQRAAVTQFPQAGSRGLLWTHRALHLEPQAETQEALAGDPGVANEGCLPALPDTPAPRKQTPRLGTRRGPARSIGGRERTPATRARSKETDPGPGPGPPSSALGSVTLSPGGGDQPPARRALRGGRPAGPPAASGSQVLGDAAGRRLGRKYGQRWRHEALLRRLQGSERARRLAATWQRWVDAQGGERLARTLLRRWHLKWAWRVWRRRVLQLRVAQRLQQQEGGWVLSQAFEKWCQHLAARGQKRGATSSLITAGLRSPGSSCKMPEPMCAVDLGRSRGPSCSCDLFPWKEKQH
ncbi:LOW QUALITY PROTEIN: uncharacterized protein C1orf167 homolog [Canis lupus dingo]|uniref:LOW QUALITY PROTEIN: uncharacterized protein C1orf167 homolog n=1 Tax=Canis lupus dingo TaxID=286419 RepID=UPI0020C58B36|nr:LOW QUALITY PROTEIN: uncharacterized protein C1orf167 homolog [Canis lupus dingo]